LTDHGTIEFEYEQVKPGRGENPFESRFVRSVLNLRIVGVKLSVERKNVVEVFRPGLSEHARRLPSEDGWVLVGSTVVLVVACTFRSDAR
jgi:hypothetical protein